MVLQEAYLLDNIADPYQLNKVPLSTKPEVAHKLLVFLGEELKRTNDPWDQERKYGVIIPYP